MNSKLMIMITLVDWRENKHTHTTPHTITHTRGLETKQQQNRKRKKVPMGLTSSWMLRSAPAATRACTHSTLPL